MHGSPVKSQVTPLHSILSVLTNVTICASTVNFNGNLHTVHLIHVGTGWEGEDLEAPTVVEAFVFNRFQAVAEE